MKSLIALTLLATSSFATADTSPTGGKTYTYECTDLDKEEEPRTMTFRDDKVVVEGGWDDTGTLDKSYKPSPANAGTVRYWLEDSTDGYSNWLLVEKTMLKGGKMLRIGKKGGFVKHQARGEGFFNYRFICILTGAQG